MKFKKLKLWFNRGVKPNINRFEVLASEQVDDFIMETVTGKEWVEFKDEKPPHEVVLAACDTYDCGWTMDTVWWYEDKKCWMTTGGVNSTEAHLPYTHWRTLPPFPNEK